MGKNSNPVVSSQVPQHELDHVDALARKLNVRRSDVVRAFVAAGIRSNPLTPKEIRDLLSLPPSAPKEKQRDPVIEVLEDGALQPLRAEAKEKDGGETGIRTRESVSRLLV